MYIAVASPSTVGLVARINSVIPSGPISGLQFLDPDLARPDTVDGRQRASEDVIPAPELLGPLHNHHVLGALDDAHQSDVTPRIPADRTFLASSDVEATAAEPDLLPHVDDGGGQTPGIGLLDREQMERKSLRSLLANAWKPAELIDEPLDGSFEHQPRMPPRSSPPVRPPSSSDAAAAAASNPCRTAVRTRSSSISMSSGSTTSGEMRDGDQFLASGHRGGDHPASRAAHESALRQLGLSGGELGLHLLGLLHQLTHVGLAIHEPRVTATSSPLLVEYLLLYLFGS